LSPKGSGPLRGLAVKKKYKAEAFIFSLPAKAGKETEGHQKFPMLRQEINA
jgi:hypothetical protein